MTSPQYLQTLSTNRLNRLYAKAYAHRWTHIMSMCKAIIDSRGV